LVTSIWEEDDHLAVSADVKERSATVLTNGLVSLRTGNR
jgi:hypothetical protein